MSADLTSTQPSTPANLNPMQITLHLPDDLALHANPAREVLEAFVIEGYRSGALTPFQSRLMLGFSTRYQLDGFLKDHNVEEHAYSLDDLREDAQGFARDAGSILPSA